MIYIKDITNKYIPGFTLVEAMVSITILLLVIIGPMTIAQKGIQNAYYANEQITAVFLAQEAIEGVRKLRDDKALEAHDVYGTSNQKASGYTQGWIPSGCTGGCAYTDAGLIASCSTNNNCILKYDNDSKEYFQSGSGTDSIYTRKVYIVKTPMASDVNVRVEVTWSSRVFGGAIKTVALQTWVYDHYQRYESN